MPAIATGAQPPTVAYKSGASTRKPLPIMDASGVAVALPCIPMCEPRTTTQEIPARHQGDADHDRCHEQASYFPSTRTRRMLSYGSRPRRRCVRGQSASNEDRTGRENRQSIGVVRPEPGVSWDLRNCATRAGATSPGSLPSERQNQHCYGNPSSCFSPTDRTRLRCVQHSRRIRSRKNCLIGSGDISRTLGRAWWNDARAICARHGVALRRVVVTERSTASLRISEGVR